MENFELRFEAIGTKWTIECWNSPLSESAVFSLVKKQIEIFDKTYSRFRSDSLVWKISQKEGEYIFPEDSKTFFDLYEKLYKITEGSFTLLIGNTLDEAGYDPDYGLVPKQLNKIPKPNELFSFVFPKLKIKKPYILDFGGLGKGYLIDILTELLIQNNINSFVIEAGGDIRCLGLSKKLSVGLENPLDPSQALGVIRLLNESICASGGNKRKWANYHHIIDANRLSSPDKILATWVIAGEAIIADAVSTCLFLTSPEKLKENFNFEYLILYPDFSIDKSANFSAELFIKKS